MVSLDQPMPKLPERFPLIALVLSVALYGSLYVQIAAKTPFAEGQDAFAHMKYATNILETQRLDFAYNTTDTQPPIYQFFPLLHITLAMLVKFTGLELPVAATAINIVFVLTLPLLFYALGTRLFGSRLAGLFAALLYLFPGIFLNPDQNDFYRFLSPYYLSLILFLIGLIFLLDSLRNKRHLTVRLGYLAVIAGMILSHPQSAVGRWLVVVLIALLFTFRPAYRRLALPILIFTIIPIAVLLVLYHDQLGYFLNVGQAFTAASAPFGQADSPTTENLYSILGNYGFLTFIFSIVGFIAIFSSDRKRIPWSTKVVLLVIVTTNLLLTFQTAVGLNFFPGRFKTEIHIPAFLIGGYGMVLFLQAIRYRRFLLLPILATMIIPTVIYLAEVRLNIDWGDLQGVLWAKEHLRGSTVLADPYTFYLFQSVGGFKPAYGFSSTDFTRQLKEEPTIQQVFGADAASAFAYAKANGIDYIIVDYRRNPQRLSGDYGKFSDERYFRPVYSTSSTGSSGEKRLVIYGLAPSTPPSIRPSS